MVFDFYLGNRCISRSFILTDCVYVYAGVGIEHERLVDLAKESFAKKPVWAENKTLVQKPMERDLSMAQYTGGKVEVNPFQLFFHWMKFWPSAWVNVYCGNVLEYL